MDNLTDLDNTKDVIDAAIEWVLRETHAACNNIENARIGADDGYGPDCARILAARLIQRHRPELLVDPDLPEAREIVARVFSEDKSDWHALKVREGKGDDWTATRIAIAAIKRGRQLEQMK